ncbi:uncharacterized protein J8A68_002950 [[Candida] subhashii]|uniref:Extracellular membrane protein CFEM domain-containing protein n=1 Tax=[Candida] subhashii TaxID=561895 RepID=A0A8J5QKB6_9ASCO|nr:uncharacterized protein J8A68_002950 [[Candida] subhashii]KAG7663564.1 hypothetical protein J8A68_002950 [[Candida] subhashii]
MNKEIDQMSILRFILLFTLLYSVNATPPSCFLSCVGEVTRDCHSKLTDVTCACISEDKLIGCLVDICPYGTFLSARDHFMGTCLEHGRPTVTNRIGGRRYTGGFGYFLLFLFNNNDNDENIDDKAPANKPLIPRRGGPSKPQSPNVRKPRPTRVQKLPPKYTTPSDPQPAPRRENRPPPPHPPSEDDSDNEYNPDRGTLTLLWLHQLRLPLKYLIRRPINVPKKYRDPNNLGKPRRVLIKRPVKYYQQDSAAPKRKSQHVKRISSLSLTKKPVLGSTYSEDINPKPPSRFKTSKNRPDRSSSSFNS